MVCMVRMVRPFFTAYTGRQIHHFSFSFFLFLIILPIRPAFSMIFKRLYREDLTFFFPHKISDLLSTVDYLGRQ